MSNEKKQINENEVGKVSGGVIPTKPLTKEEISQIFEKFCSEQRKRPLSDWLVGESETGKKVDTKYLCKNIKKK